MYKKLLFGSVAGTAVIFIQAGFFYGYLFADFFADAIPSEFAGITKVTSSFPLILVSDFLFAGLLSFLFAYFGVESFKKGAFIGSIIGFIVVLHFDLISAATTNLTTPPSIALNVVTSAFMSAVGGGTIGMVLGKVGKSDPDLA